MIALVFCLLAGDVAQSAVSAADFGAFAGALQMLDHVPVESLLNAYLAKLESAWWRDAGWRDERLAEIERVKHAIEAWRLLSYARACSQGYERYSLFELRKLIGDEAYYLGRMPALPEGVWWREFVLPAGDGEWRDRLPMPRIVK